MSLGPKRIDQFSVPASLTGNEYVAMQYGETTLSVQVRQLANYVGTPVGTLSNPMTAQGDLLYGGTVVGGFAVPSRLGIGSTGQVLKIAGGLPAWSTLATVATSGAYSDLSGTPFLGSLAAYNFPGGTTLFLRADGSWTAPQVTFANVTGAVSTNSALQTALDLKQNRSPSIQGVTTSATVTPTFSNDMVAITAQAVGLTLANPTGTAIDGYGLVIRIKDNGTARTIAYGAQYRAIGVTLPTTTVLSKTLYLGMIYNAADTKWDVTAVAQEA